MLDMRRVNHFRYDAKQMFMDSTVEQNVWTPLLSSIVAKASRTGIKDAWEYVNMKEDEGVLPEDVAESLRRLLERYKKWR